MSRQTNLFLKLHLGLMLLLFLSSCDQNNQDLPIIELTIENHLFLPENVIIPANTKVNLLIHNKDETAEEFECPALRKEKIISPKSKVNVIIAPLEPGVYEFFGDFHQHLARGKIIVN
jgi:heme/copper-type cytochrome/quinol oxidase subunit 2